MHCLPHPKKDLLYPSVSLPTSLSGGVQSENKSSPSVGLHMWFWRRLGEFCQLSETNRCQHLFRYRLWNSLVAAVAILTGPSASHPFALPVSPPASLSVTSACCLLKLKMRGSKIKSSEKNILHCTYLYLCQNFYFIIATSGHVSGIHCVLLHLQKCPGSAKMS